MIYFVLAVCTLVEAFGTGFKKGFVQMPRGEIMETAITTDEMRRTAPSKLDWSTLGATTPVKDQGECGSCWAYSATEGIESALFMATGKLEQLSEQQIISCDGVDHGCEGGDIPNALNYVLQSGGIELQADYPDSSSIAGHNGNCTAHVSKEVAKVTSYRFAIPECKDTFCSNQSEIDLMPQLAANGPLSICVNAMLWPNYTGGILTEGCGGAIFALDHCVQLVGYDFTVPIPYWKVRNSWGTSWGEGGYIRIAMGHNRCGIADVVVAVDATRTNTEVSV